jgi:hypothetical protein
MCAAARISGTMAVRLPTVAAAARRYGEFLDMPVALSADTG